MALKKRISYQWQLFIPIATVLCLVFGLLIFYQYKREADFRADPTEPGQIADIIRTAIALSLPVALLIVFFITRALSRNIIILREFAHNVTSGKIVRDDYVFPPNELGDISREILKFYHERNRHIDEIEHERKVTNHAIEEKINLARQMTNNINHEIKTPVGIIRGYLETIINNPDMDAATRSRFLNQMMANIERLTALLDDISTITRLENAPDTVALDRIDIHDLAYRIAYDLPANNLAGDMKFSFDIPLGSEVTGNHTLLHDMLCGLIKNAASYSGGTEIHFDLISENDRFYIFRFADNGIGVDESHIPRLFDRFYRIDTGRSRKLGGTGLGLPIVKDTIMSLGGTISVHNRSTGGLEYTFTLPKWHPRHPLTPPVAPKQH